jgi:geranylgeranyl pyrophosphate synthase
VSAIAPAPALARWLAEVVPTIDDAIERRLPAHDGGADGGDDAARALWRAMRYAALGEGKRLRPALAVAACEAVGGTRASAWPVAAAVELCHAYTLVHDDLPALDDDDERRGRPTVHRAFGEATAILAGDALLTAAFGALAELGERAGEAIAVLATRAGAGELIAGQARDLALVGAPSLAALQAIHRGKTGALFAAAAELGAIAGGADVAARASLRRYGFAVGVAFQFADDRDDGDHPEVVARARATVAAEIGEAEAIARSLGAAGEPLALMAQWIGARV